MCRRLLKLIFVETKSGFRKKIDKSIGRYTRIFRSCRIKRALSNRQIQIVQLQLQRAHKEELGIHYYCVQVSGLKISTGKVRQDVETEV